MMTHMKGHCCPNKGVLQRKRMWVSILLSASDLADGDTERETGFKFLSEITEIS